MRARRRDPFAALADPTRRAVLELLRDSGPLRAGQVAEAFPGLSRAAVSKHLGVLRSARLVRRREVGRESHYSLDTAPLLEVYEQWIARFLPGFEDALQELKRRVEGDTPPITRNA